MDDELIIAALGTKFASMDLDEVTLREYLKELLLTLLDEQEGFSGKRPFGNSGWIYDPIKPLVMAGAVEGRISEDGWPEDYDEAQADAALKRAVELL